MIEEEIKDTLAVSNDLKDESVNPICVSPSHLVCSNSFAFYCVNEELISETIQIHSKKHYQELERAAALKKVTEYKPPTHIVAHAESITTSLLSLEEVESEHVPPSINVRAGTSAYKKIRFADLYEKRNPHPSKGSRSSYKDIKLVLVRELGCIQNDRDPFKRKVMMHMWPKWKSKQVAINFPK